MRNTFSNKIYEFAKNGKDFIVLTADLGYTVFDKFREHYPDKFYNVGIAENNMVSVAAGMSLVGKKVFVYSISTFLAYKCIEQIREDICHNDLDVIIVGVGSGFAYGSTGSSHHSTEDIGCLRSIPNLTILSPSDPSELNQLMDNIFEYRHPIYLRIGKANEKIFTSSTDVTIGKAYYLVKEKDIALVTYGNIIEEVVKARELLKVDNLNVSLVSCHTIKPLDVAFFEELFKCHKYVFVIEEHNEIGGLGEAIACKLKQSVHQIAIKDLFIYECGNSSYLRQVAGIDSESIYKQIKKILSSKQD